MRSFSLLPHFAFALMLFGCSSEKVAGPAAFEWLPENRGTALPTINLNVNAGLVWELSDEIVYASINPFGGEAHIRAIRISDGSARVVDGPRARHIRVSMSPGGRDLYFLLASATNVSGPLYVSVDGAPPLVLTERAPYAGPNRFTLFGPSVLPTHDGRYAAFLVTPDSVRIFDTANGSTRHLATGCRFLLSFSPDDSELLCQLNQEFSVLSIADGSRRALTLPSEGQGLRPSALNWTPDGLQFVHSFYPLTELVNTSTHQLDTLYRRPVATGYDSFAAQALEEIKWSPDGRRLVLPIVRTERGFSDEGKVQTELTLFDVRTRRSSRVAVVDGRVVHVTFAPDGTRLAYVAVKEPTASSVYVVSLP